MQLSEQFEKQGAWLFKYRGVLPIAILAVGASLYIRTKLYPESFFLEGTSYEKYYEAACLITSLCGFAIRVYTVGYSPPNTSGRNTQEQLAEQLNIKGIYSIVRNPLYLGNFFMWLGLALITGNFWFIASFVLLYVLYYERIIYTEEQFLKRKFGQQFTRWAGQTPAIVPNIRLFSENEYPFSWRKVLRQEKNGLAALFLIYCAFDIVGELVKGRREFNYYLLVGTVLSVVAYLVLKYLKYNSTLLEER